MGRALRTRFASVDDVVVPVAPGDAEIGGLRTRAESFDAVVVGTIEAHRQSRQAALVRAIAETGTPTVAVAMRTPWDAVVYPEGVPAIATYSILPDSLEALARALAGEIGFPGRLPVAVPRADRAFPPRRQRPERAASTRFLAEHAAATSMLSVACLRVGSPRKADNAAPNAPRGCVRRGCSVVT